ncbi:MAG TPA: sigma-70 family RNA polymerase sigma factor [Urbifossiella sp.]|nr:sigma-70 family RNA polymerase sigma factor [Urbifossiella sp.]
MNDDDRRLIAESLAGRRDAFGELVSRYQGRLYNAAFRLVDSPDDAADVVQDAFLNAYQSLHAFKGDAEFFTWLYRIAFNGAISLKRKKRPTASLDAADGDRGYEPPDPSDHVRTGHALERTEEDERLYAAIARMTPEHREVLTMKDLDGLRYEEMAELLAVPIGTIRSRLHRARLELRNLLAPADDEDEPTDRGRGERPPPDPN